MGSQIVQMASAFVLMGLVYTNVVHVWHVLALSFISGTAQAFGGPAYQSLIPQLIPKQDLPNAIALNSIQFNLARVVGPLAAGAALTAFGSAVCFGLNGLSFVAVIVGLLLLHVQHVKPATRHRMSTELGGGISYVRQQPALVSLTALAFVATFLGIPLLTFLPVFAQDVFKEGVANTAG